VGGSCVSQSQTASYTCKDASHLARSPRDDLTNDLQTWLITQGASWTQAGDYVKTTRAVGGQYTIEEWAEVRGTSHQAVSDARGKAERAMADALPEEKPALPGGLNEPSIDDLD